MCIVIQKSMVLHTKQITYKSYKIANGLNKVLPAYQTSIADCTFAFIVNVELQVSVSSK